MPDKKSSWIIAPNNKSPIIFEGIEADETQLRSTTETLTAEDMQRLKLAPMIKDDPSKLSICKTVGSINCPSVTISNCDTLIYCGNVAKR